MVYGQFPDSGVTEETPLNPIGIYGALKLAGEKLVIAYNQVFNLPYTIVRPSALYGERCVSQRVSQIFIENAIKKENIIIQGDGSDSLDFTYIQDLTDGIKKIIESDNSINQVFNITYGECRSINQLAKIIQEQFPEIKIIYQLKKDSLMPERGTLIVDKAKKLIDYHPVYPIETGLRNYIKWYKEIIN